MHSLERSGSCETYENGELEDSEEEEYEHEDSSSCCDRDDVAVTCRDRTLSDEVERVDIADILEEVPISIRKDQGFRSSHDSKRASHVPKAACPDQHRSQK